MVRNGGPYGEQRRWSAMADSALRGGTLWPRVGPGIIRAAVGLHRDKSRVQERVCELRSYAEGPSPRPSPGGRESDQSGGFLNGRRIVPHVEFADTL